MIVGFTGTRAWMSLAQQRQLVDVLRWLGAASRAEGRVSEFHHGAAEGADTEAAHYAREQGYCEVPHPAGSDPLQRNREIVAAVDVLIAAPLTDKEERRSGTWATVRYARAAQKPVVMLSRGDR